MTRPESFPKQFNVYEQETKTSDRGRVRIETPTAKAEFRGILSIARAEEQQRYAQVNVTITHTIIQRGKPTAQEQDIIKLVKQGKETRKFRIQAVHNKGEMDIDTVYYCEERGDLK